LAKTRPLDYLGYNFVADTMTQTRDVVFSQSYQIRWNNPKWRPFKIIIFGTIGSSYAISCMWVVVTQAYLSSWTVSDIWRISGPIFGVDRGTYMPLFKRTRSLTPKFRIAKFAIKKPETSLYRMVWSVFRHLKPLVVILEYVRRIDRHSDCKGRAYYVARPKLTIFEYSVWKSLHIMTRWHTMMLF